MKYSTIFLLVLIPSTSLLLTGAIPGILYTTFRGTADPDPDERGNADSPAAANQAGGRPLQNAATPSATDSLQDAAERALDLPFLIELPADHGDHPVSLSELTDSISVWISRAAGTRIHFYTTPDDVYALRKRSLENFNVRLPSITPGTHTYRDVLNLISPVDGNTFHISFVPDKNLIRICGQSFVSSVDPIFMHSEEAVFTRTYDITGLIPVVRKTTILKAAPEQLINWGLAPVPPIDVVSPSFVIRKPGDLTIPDDNQLKQFNPDSIPDGTVLVDAHWYHNAVAALREREQRMMKEQLIQNPTPAIAQLPDLIPDEGAFMELILHHTSPHVRWMRLDAEGGALQVQNNRLLVSQTIHGHKVVEDLLALLRDTVPPDEHVVNSEPSPYSKAQVFPHGPTLFQEQKD
ncbi:MAG: hypothetical protein JNL58_25135 [Planctomyces sp.]|nr:hypothetical protein [Planctomyces sp.]